MFKWVAGQELLPGESLASLAAVAGLEKGRSDARERPLVQPVAEETVECERHSDWASPGRLDREAPGSQTTSPAIIRRSPADLPGVHPGSSAFTPPFIAPRRRFRASFSRWLSLPVAMIVQR